MEEFKYQVKKGFEKCKLDIEDIKQENFTLKHEINQVKEINQNLNLELSELKAELKGLKIALDYIKEFKDSTPAQPTIQQPTAEPVTVTPQIPQKQTQQTKDPYEALLAFKAKTNKRELLKQKMITIVGENGINLSELKFLFVDHYKYCSKATFYNYLKELEMSSQIKINRENSKNFVYLTHLVKNEI